MTPFKLARLSLSRHRFTTAVTAAAIGLSVACGGILLRLHQLSDSRFSTIGHGGDAIVGAKAGGIEILLGSLNGEGDFPDFLPVKLFESLRAEQTVRFEDGASSTPSFIETAVPFVYFAKYGPHRVAGTDESFFRRSRSGEAPVLQEGRWFSNKEEVVLGAAVARENDLKTGDILRVHPWIGAEPLAPEVALTVSGIMAPTGGQWDRTLFASVDQAYQVFEQNAAAMAGRSIWGPRVLHYFLIDLKPGGFTQLEALINRRTVGQAIDVEKQIERLHDISGAGQSIGLFVTAFLLVLSGLSVCAMLVTRFEGMSLQIAVLRALGYTKKELARWLLWEGFLLGLMGVALGALIDGAGFPILRSILGAVLPPPDLVAGSIFASAPIWIMAMIATVAAVSIPALRMARQDTHKALKGL